MLLTVDCWDNSYGCLSGAIIALCRDPQERLFIHGEWQDGLTNIENAPFAALADEIEP